MTRQRDTFIDCLRVLSVTCIVLGHWLSAKVWWNSGHVGVSSIVSDVPGFSVASWVFMAVPVIFFVGGFSNFVALDRCRELDRGIRKFYGKRLRRLLRPVVFFIGCWAAAETLSHLFSLGGQGLLRAVTLKGDGPFGPLWFVAVYLGVIIICPYLVRLHFKWQSAVPTVLALGCIGIDFLRFVEHVPVVGWLNLGLAWLFPHQLGFFYADGSFSRLSLKTVVGMSGLGLAGLISSSGMGVYAPAIGKVHALAISNMAPPTFMIVSLSLFQIGLVLSCRRRLLSALRRHWAEHVVHRLTAVTMSIFLWHMTALLVALVLLSPAKLSASGVSLTSWWVQRPIWLVVSTVVLGVVTKFVAWTEIAGWANPPALNTGIRNRHPHRSRNTVCRRLTGPTSRPGPPGW